MIAGDERAITGEVWPGERGSALIIALLVMVVMTLLGVPFLLMGETENRIAENEILSVQAVYAAESGAQMVKRWFDQPLVSSNLINPPLAAIDRTLRMIDEDGDPATAPVAADGSPTRPWYKGGRDLDGDGDDDIFQEPYRSDLVDTFLGTEDGPDMRIDRADSTAAEDFLNDLSEKLFADDPPGGYQARVSRIDLYAPPSFEKGGVWTRFGVATAKVVAGIYQEGGAERLLSERSATFVFSEVPYRTRELGALHSCGDLTWGSGFTAHWGVATAAGTANLGDHTQLPASLARAVPSSLWGDDFLAVLGVGGAPFVDYKNELENPPTVIDDPWLRFVSGQALTGAPNSDEQPWPFSPPWSSGDLADGQYPYHPGGTEDGSHSAFFQNKTVGCPQFPYATWKTIAIRGGPGVHYYVWSPADGDEYFKENGMGPARTFREITDGRDGLFFFDTADGLPPAADGSNLTAAISMTGGTWGARGFIYLNADLFQSHAVAGRPVPFQPPGEPFLDSVDDDNWDGEEYINLDYPSALAGTDSQFKADHDDDFGGSLMRNDRGPVITEDANFWGVFYTSGRFDSTGIATYYGSVIAERGIDSVSVAIGTPDIYWDQDLHANWPPIDWGLPRVVIMHWETDL